MCDFSGKLIAWLDHELPQNETAEVQRHVSCCVECRSSLDRYARVSRAFDAYCDAALAASVRRNRPSWALVLSGAVAAAVVLFVVFPRARVESLPLRPPAPVAASVAVLEAPAAAPARTSKKSVRRYSEVPPRRQDADWQPAEPYIEVAIPAEAIFAPGAVPEGFNFIADVSFAADGSAQGLHLRPRVIELQRSEPQP